MAFVTYLLRADLRQRWRSLTVLALLVAIVVAAVLTAAAGARRTRTSFERYLDEIHPIELLLLVEGDPIPEEAVAAIDGVDEAIGFDFYLAVPETAGDAFFPMLTARDTRVPDDYLRYPVVAGRLPDPTAPLEIALGERTARRLGVEVGDVLPMDSYTPAQVEDPDSFGDPQGPDLAMDVVGIVRTAGDVSSRENDLDLTFPTPAFGERYADEIGLFATALMVDLAPGASVEEVTTAVTRLGDVEIDTFLSRKDLESQVNPTLSSMANGLRLIAFVIALAGLITIFQALARAATDRAGDHDGLRALGATRATLLLRLIVPSTLTSGAGVLVGVAASVPASALLPLGLARRAEVDLGTQVDGPVLAVGLVATTVLLAIAIVAASALALRRDQQPHHRPVRARSLASRAAGLGAPVSVVSGLRLALDAGRGVRATPVRAATGAVALGAVGVLATVVFGSSLHHAIVTPDVYGWGWDAALSGSGGDQVSDGVVDEAALIADGSFDAVAELIHDLEVTVDGDPQRAVVLEDRRGHTSFVLVDGQEPRADDEVAVGGRTLDDLGLDLGDTIDVSAGGPARPLQIVGVVALPVGVDGGSSSSGFAMSRAAADGIGFTGSCDGDVACSRTYVVTAAAGVDPVSAALAHADPDRIEVLEPSPPSEVARLTAVEDLPRILAGFLGIIAIVAITHAATVTVRRRRRDLALLRVFGFSARQLRTVVAVQVGALALAGAALGAVVGIVVGRQAWTVVADGVSLPVVIITPALAVVAVPIAIVALSHAGATMARIAAGRVRAGVALRTE